MSDEEKLPYQAKAQDDTARYREAMVVWRHGGEGAGAFFVLFLLGYAQQAALNAYLYYETGRLVSGRISCLLHPWDGCFCTLNFGVTTPKKCILFAVYLKPAFPCCLFCYFWVSCTVAICSIIYANSL